MTGASIRVLHVDDDPAFAELAATYLKRENEQFEVETATSAEEGLDRLASTDYDCVISDYDMPRTDGIDFLERVRETSPDLPFVLFTGKGSEEIASEAIRAGVSDYLQKGSGTERYELLANRITNAVDQYRAERRLERQQQEYRELFEEAPIMYILTRDEGGRLIVEDCNERFAERLGYDRAEIIGRPTADFYTDESIAKMHEEDGYEAALGGDFGLQERTLVTKDGERVDVLNRASPRRNEQGEAIGVQALYLDVTEQRERTRRLELALDYTRSGVWEYDPDSGLVTRHEGATDLWADDAETTVSMDEAIEERVHPADRDTIWSALDATVENGEPYHVEFRHDTPDGYRWAEARGDLVVDDADDASDRLIAVTTDIHERKHREQQLRAERDRLAALFEDAPRPMVESRIEADEHRIVEVNAVFEETFGYDRDEIIGRDIAEVLVPDDERADHEQLRDRGEEGEALSVEVERTTVDGERTFMLDVVPYGTESLPADGAFAQYTDVTERREREEQLELYETMLETVPDGVYALDEDFEYIEVNQGMVDLTGYSKEELIGSRVSLLVDENVLERARRQRERLRTGEIDDTVMRAEHAHRTAGGESIPMEVRYRALPPAEDSSFRGTAGVLRDVTEQKARERELERQNDRLEEFASVVSHDLRNPLNVAEGRLDLAREECDSEHLDAAARALNRMDDLIEDLLTLAREGKTVEDPEVIALADVVDACWRNVDTADATLVVDTDWTIRADESRLRQLLENVIRNAVEHGGTDVTVTVGDLSDGTGFYVEDDGPGIPPDERERVFERGYSTADEGTGFGLAIVDEIAAAHGWEVTVTESADGGARFEITGVEPGA